MKSTGRILDPVARIGADLRGIGVDSRARNSLQLAGGFHRRTGVSQGMVVVASRGARLVLRLACRTPARLLAGTARDNAASLYAVRVGAGGRRWRWQWQGVGAATVLAGAGAARALCDTAAATEEDGDDDDGMKPEQRKTVPAPGGGQCHLPTYTMADVAKHFSPETRIWVTYKDGVYDVTEFIEGHPGGADKIMLAAGKAIDPYWNLFQQHFRTGLPLKLLEEMRIGTLAPGEYVPADLADPYAADPPRDPSLIYHNKTPCNAEVPQELLTANYLTPNHLWFVRHHHPVPLINVNSWELVVSGKGCDELRLTLDDLKSGRFPKFEVDVTIQCSGNRRSHFAKTFKKAEGIPWNQGGVSTARFGGVRLRDVLAACGLSDADAAGVRHIQFFAADDMRASIPAEKALAAHGDVILAYEMNGEAIPADHGFPVRAVVPGHVGVRNVKWVQKIVAAEDEAEGPWQRGVAYKGFAANVTDLQSIPAHVIDRAVAVQEPPVQSLLVSPSEGATLRGDMVNVSGWAYSGGGRGIVRVEVSVDGGKTWQVADLGEGAQQRLNRAWAWTFFSAAVKVPQGLSGETTVMCRATDAAYNTQAEHAQSVWNIRGICNSSWHRVPINIQR